jgi:hypothetical protein
MILSPDQYSPTCTFSRGKGWQLIGSYVLPFVCVLRALGLTSSFAGFPTPNPLPSSAFEEPLSPPPTPPPSTPLPSPPPTPARPSVSSASPSPRSKLKSQPSAHRQQPPTRRRVQHSSLLDPTLHQILSSWRRRWPRTCSMRSARSPRESRAQTAR